MQGSQAQASQKHGSHSESEYAMHRSSARGVRRWVDDTVDGEGCDRARVSDRAASAAPAATGRRGLHRPSQYQHYAHETLHGLPAMAVTCRPASGGISVKPMSHVSQPQKLAAPKYWSARGRRRGG